MRQLIHDREDYKIAKQQISLLELANKTLADFGDHKDSVINTYSKLDSTRLINIDVLNKQIGTVQSQFHLTQEYAKQLEGKLKKERCRTYTVGGIGILVSVTLLVLLVAK